MPHEYRGIGSPSRSTSKGIEHRGALAYIAALSFLPCPRPQSKDSKIKPRRCDWKRHVLNFTQHFPPRPAGPSITLVARHVRVPVYEMPRAQSQLECCRAHNLPITHHNSGTGEFLCAACVTAAGGGARGLTPIQEAYKSEVRTMASFVTYNLLLLLIYVEKISIFRCYCGGQGLEGSMPRGPDVWGCPQDEERHLLCVSGIPDVVE